MCVERNPSAQKDRKKRQIYADYSIKRLYTGSDGASPLEKPEGRDEKHPRGGLKTLGSGRKPEGRVEKTRGLGRENPRFGARKPAVGSRNPRFGA